MANPYDRAAPKRATNLSVNSDREARDFLRYVAEILMPQFAVHRSRNAALTPQLAGIAASELGAVVADVSGERSAIRAALDLVSTGYRVAGPAARRNPAHWPCNP